MLSTLAESKFTHSTFRPIRDHLPFHAANTFMDSMISSHLSYCVHKQLRKQLSWLIVKACDDDDNDMQSSN